LSRDGISGEVQIDAHQAAGAAAIATADDGDDFGERFQVDALGQFDRDVGALGNREAG
jgi:hypothetical protein